MGCRVLQVAPFLVETWLTEGVDALVPIDAPKEVEVLSSRMTFHGHPTIELLLKSASWDGSDTETFDTAKRWAATFKRVAPIARAGGKDAGKR